MPIECHNGLPENIRISIGTAIMVGLLNGKLDAQPTTAYLMTYRLGKCNANCGFCPQAKTSKSNTELLSRVTWPRFPTLKVLEALAYNKKKFNRVCIQALNYPEVFEHIEPLVKGIKKHCLIPVSVSCQPNTKEDIEKLAYAGVDRIGIALDVATPELFDKIKGTGSSYKWDNLFGMFDVALSVFGKGKISTHVIIGLGETEKEATQIIQKCFDRGILPALFAFTPIRGTKLEERKQPSIRSYRRVQLARYLIVNCKLRVENMQFNFDGKIIDFGVESNSLDPLIDKGLPFLTSGCPDCNRPFYNEKPTGPIFNYPKQPSKQELENVKKELS